MNKVSRAIAVAVCALAIVALPLTTSCSSVVSAVNSLMGSSSSSAESVADTYYLGIDENGNLALYKGTPGDGSAPVRVTDVAVEDLHESVVAGLEEGIVFDSFNEALERIGEYRQAAQAAEEVRVAKEALKTSSGQEAGQAELEESNQRSADVDTFEQESVAEGVSDQGSQRPDEPETVAQAASDEFAPTGEFWGVWLNTFTDLGEAYACADQAKSQGFASEVFEVTNWDGTVYVVGAGEFAAKSEAQAVLDRAQSLGYTSAYLHTAARQ